MAATAPSACCGSGGSRAVPVAVAVLSSRSYHRRVVVAAGLLGEWRWPQQAVETKVQSGSRSTLTVKWPLPCSQCELAVAATAPSVTLAAAALSADGGGDARCGQPAATLAVRGPVRATYHHSARALRIGPAAILGVCGVALMQNFLRDTPLPSTRSISRWPALLLHDSLHFARPSGGSN
ncbi:hypothetical protein CYMTET_46381 [Cymbomonas tetramitiformis]|uniref:Uncharacterized protein n=1 Tax=Cymbomonas tetramitiformis TaxID=36881 RepID=A0AAE0BWC9_9CHLO|nr:hypothetical protein CYMTET_46381 [Cymbomonas tetramitiformis]